MDRQEEFRPQALDSNLNLQLKAFLYFRETGRIPLKHGIPLALGALIRDIPFAILKNWPGPIGIKFRQIYYKFKFQSMGRNVIIETGVDMFMPQNIAVSDFVFIDKNVVLNPLAGRLTIGRRIHIAVSAIISGAADIDLGDYCAIGAGAKIYSHSEAPVNGKRMSGPMIPESMKGTITAPITIGKDAVIGAGAVVLPGCTIGEGAVVGANSLVTAKMRIPPYAIYVGVPAKFAGMRERVVVPDI